MELLPFNLIEEDNKIPLVNTQSLDSLETNHKGKSKWCNQYCKYQIYSCIFKPYPSSQEVSIKVSLRKIWLAKIICENKQPVIENSTGLWSSRMRVSPKSTILGIPS